jgi:ergothioneine biosynthesis protein EgtB
VSQPAKRPAQQAWARHGLEAPQDLGAFFRDVRAATRNLADPLSDADATAQSMPDASPAKWHLAHTSWFFEAMLLQRNALAYRLFDPNFHYLFNSYYEALGARQPRPRRGLLTRPSLDEVMAYRSHVDAAVERLLENELSPHALAALELGCHHEQQHQELLLTDILHLFAQNPLAPAYGPRKSIAASALSAPARFKNFEGGLVEIGAEDAGFAFDCERPRHRAFIEPFSLADRPVTNVEWMEFIADGGYRSPLLWLSEGWARCCAEKWSAPGYWEERDGETWTMTLSGRERINLNAPVVHVSYFEADAYARWAKRRLPTEVEWEHAAASLPPEGNFAESGRLRPTAAGPDPNRGLRQMFGDVWEWTQSPFTPYPRFRAPDGPMGEYNGKFMCGQYVLRGGSCATPASHMRPTYRNFFFPDARWQFSGLRLADDGV